MRSFLMDEIAPSDLARFVQFLKRKALPSELDTLFWIQMPRDTLNDIQFQHRDCYPHVFAVELGTDWIRMEFYVRTLKNVTCDCQGYCTAPQGDFILKFAHKAIADLRIQT